MGSLIAPLTADMFMNWLVYNVNKIDAPLTYFVGM